MKPEKDLSKIEKSSEDEYRKKMINQKEDYEEYKKKEGDADLIFNEKDNKNKTSDKK